MKPGPRKTRRNRTRYGPSPNPFRAFAFLTLALGCTLAVPRPSLAHFGMILPSDPIVSTNDPKEIRLEVRFLHPMEGTSMSMARPESFAVRARGGDTELLETLEPRKDGDGRFWVGSFRIRRPGDHVFYVEPQPYYEPTEQCFIQHFTKTVVNAMGMERGWDEPLGLEAEIVPLTRPYGLWDGNLFCGQVLLRGEKKARVPVEVEHYNVDGRLDPPDDPYITQVTHTDPNGVFCYSFPVPGWWGFAALMESPERRPGPDGKEIPVEVGAVIWVYVHEVARKR